MNLWESSNSEETWAPMGADVFLSALASHGVDYFFGTPGSDFPPLIEAFERADQRGIPVPQPILVPHEALTIAMAHGVYLMNGRTQAAMVHTNGGTGNTILNLINIAHDYGPVLLLAGRTPITESGHPGSRNRQIHWGQEMYDQAGMVRESVKWDYELRYASQIGDVVTRAMEFANTPPQGPVYLSLPREPLAESVPQPLPPVRPRAVADPPRPAREAVATLAAWIAEAERPLLVTSAAGRRTEAVSLLAACTERYAIAVASPWPRRLNLPTDHPMLLGYDPTGVIGEADLIITLECEVPWYPVYQQPAPGCKFVNISQDSTFAAYPMRSFPSDLTIAAGTVEVLVELDEAMKSIKVDEERISERRERIAAQTAARRKALAEALHSSGDQISPAYATACISDAVGLDAVILNEYPLSFDYLVRKHPGTFFMSHTMAGGLGYSLGAALGMKLAAPDKMMVAAVGDGTYMFSSPMVAHWMSEKYNLPILVVVFSNGFYNAVRQGTLGMYPKGVAAQKGARLFSDLTPLPPFEEFVSSQGGLGIRVEKAQELPDALSHAVQAVTAEGRQALVNIIIGGE